MQESFTFAQGLPLAGKWLATLVATAVWLFVCYVVWQKPKAASHPEIPAQVSSAAKSDAQASSAAAEQAATPRQYQPKRVKKPRDKPAATAPVVSVGNVSSQNQTGGVTAGYVGSVDQAK